MPLSMLSQGRLRAFSGHAAAQRRERRPGQNTMTVSGPEPTLLTDTAKVRSESETDKICHINQQLQRQLRFPRAIPGSQNN